MASVVIRFISGLLSQLFDVLFKVQLHLSFHMKSFHTFITAVRFIPPSLFFLSLFRLQVSKGRNLQTLKGVDICTIGKNE